MPKDLRDIINGVESNEKESAVLQTKINRLTELLEKQKRVMRDQEDVIASQKQKISRMYDIPEDVLELKELIVTQRATITEKESQIEHAKGDVAAIKKQLELTAPTHQKLNESIKFIGTLKAELAEKNTEIQLKEEEIKVLQNKVKEIQAFADKIQDEQVNLLSDIDQKWKKELENLRLEHLEEKKDMASKIAQLDGFLLDSKLTSTEATSEAKDLKSRFQEIRDKQEELLNKYEEAKDQRREAEEKLRDKVIEMEVLTKFREDNIQKISYYDRLSELMEHEAQFKAFLILEKVRSMAIEDLRNALGSPIVLVKKLVQNLESVGLIEVDETGKINLKKLD